MKRLLFILVPLLMLSASMGYTEAPLDVKTSNPADGFIISIPKHWNEKVYPTEKGTTYAYWDNICNALTITVREPNSFKQVLTMINDGKFNIKHLKMLENNFK